MSGPVTHADELPYDGDAAGLTAEDVQAAIDELAVSPGGSFDPDAPLDYFTMEASDGGLWTVTVATDGTLTTTAFEPLQTEAGDLLMTEAGDVLVLE